jgi:hypothetical protein
MRFAIVAMLALVCAVSNAEARQRHRVATRTMRPSATSRCRAKALASLWWVQKNAGLAIGLCGGTAFATIAFHIWRHPS